LYKPKKVLCRFTDAIYPPTFEKSLDIACITWDGYKLEVVSVSTLYHLSDKSGAERQQVHRKNPEP
jgi:hypothetical protein